MGAERHILAGAVGVLAFLATSSFASAASEAELDALHDALGTETLLEIMRDEGLSQSEDLREDMFPGRGGESWTRLVSDIYDVSRMSRSFRAVFDAELSGVDIASLNDFFRSDVGRRIVGLEIEARRAVMEPDVEEAARMAYADMKQSGQSRASLLGDFVDQNDLVEYNVMGAMNSNLAFMRGLDDGQALDLPEREIVADVWSREAEIREETTDWIFAYLTLAYDELSDEEIRSYVELSSTDAGRDLNRALFAGFDRVFYEVSYSLGRTASQFVGGEDL